MPNRVIVLTTSPQPIYNEDTKAAEAITPGQVVTFNGGGDLIRQATAGGNDPVDVACERDEMGKSIDDPYAINDVVKVARMHAGQAFLAWIATGQNIAKGALLQYTTGGQFIVVGAGAPKVRALEAVNATAAAARIRVEVI